MTMPRRKATSFTRLFIALIIIIPLAFFAASYINQEDPVQNLKKLTGMEQAEGRTQESVTVSSKSIEELEQELDGLQQQLRNRDREIQSLKQQLKDCQ
jgi:peptidoglycan hydrolase CwlO-like protein